MMVDPRPAPASAAGAPMPAPMVIRLKNIVLFGYHGVSAAEREVGTRIEVDVDLRTTVDPRDALASTVDYSAVFRTVEAVVTGHRFQLLESLATAIRAALFAAYSADDIAVRVRKPNVPFPGGISYVEIEVGTCRL